MMMQRDRNVSSSSYSLISLLFLSIASSSPLSGSKGACWDFTEGACDLSEHNILDHDRFVDSPEECQVAIIIDLKQGVSAVNLDICEFLKKIFCNV